jgi:acetyltransferase-like isoleucine patch superfamily enzyme
MVSAAERVGVLAMPRPRSRYKLPRSAYIATALEVSLLKTAWYTLRFRRPVIVGRRSRIKVPRSARLVFEDGGMLAIGLQHLGSIGTAIELRPRSTLVIHGFVQVMRGARLSVNWDGHLEIGDQTYINDGAIIDCGERIAIGRECAIGFRSAILDTDTHRLSREGEDRPRTAAVELGDRCWIGSDATILKGVALGAGAVVAARSVVTRSVEPKRLVAGSPARALDGEVRWRP